MQNSWFFTLNIISYIITSSYLCNQALEQTRVLELTFLISPDMSLESKKQADVDSTNAVLGKLRVKFELLFTVYLFISKTL